MIVSKLSFLLICVITGLNAPQALAGIREPEGTPPSCPGVPLMIDTAMGRPVVYLINTRDRRVDHRRSSKDARLLGDFRSHAACAVRALEHSNCLLTLV